MTYLCTIIMLYDVYLIKFRWVEKRLFSAFCYKEMMDIISESLRPSGILQYI